MSAHLERAWHLYHQRRYDLAEKEVGQALLSEPNDGRALALLSLCLLEQHKFADATARAQEALANAPDDPLAHWSLAYVWLIREYLDKAETAIDNGIVVAPQFAPLYLLLGRLRYKQSRWQAAVDAADTVLELDPEDADAVNLRAESLRKLGRKGDAQEHLHEQLARDPENAWSHTTLGWNYLEAGDRKRAQHHFREALRLEPGLEWARNGVIESIKAGNPAYRAMLKYFFWISRFAPRTQLAILLGGYFGIQALARFVAEQPQYGIVVWPLIVLYAVFALSTWLASPLTNLLLFVHPLGRQALDRDERIGAIAVGTAVAIAVGAWIKFFVTSESRDFFAGYFLLSAMITVAATFGSSSPWPRKLMYGYLVFILGLVALTLPILWLPAETVQQLPGNDMVLPWFVFTQSVMTWNPLVSTLAPGILAQMRQRRD